MRVVATDARVVAAAGATWSLVIDPVVAHVVELASAPLIEALGGMLLIAEVEGDAGLLGFAIPRAIPLKLGSIIGTGSKYVLVLVSCRLGRKYTRSHAGASS